MHSTFICLKAATFIGVFLDHFSLSRAQGGNKYYTGPGNSSGYCPISACTASDCHAYQYKSGCSFNTSGICTNCTGLVAGKYFSSSGTGLTDSCVQTKCADCEAGYHNSGCSAESAGTCIACSADLLPVNNYWTIPADAMAVCPYTPQEVCPPGQKNTGYSSTSPGTCSACPALATGFYFTSPTSPTENCGTAEQKVCPAGQVNVGRSDSSAGTCQDCPALTNGKYYVDNTASSSDCLAATRDCDDNDCETGQYKKGCSGTNSGVCSACTNANSTQTYASKGGWTNTCQVQGCLKTCAIGEYVVGCGVAGVSSSSLTCGKCTNSVANVNFYVEPGGYTPTSCAVSACRVCSNGNYLMGCGGTASGECTACTNTFY